MKKQPGRIGFTLPGIGRVTPKRGESREQAERRARREHGRKSLRLPVNVPGIGKVKPRARESFEDAIARAKKKHAEKSRKGKAIKAGTEPAETRAGGKPKRKRQRRQVISDADVAQQILIDSEQIFDTFPNRSFTLRIEGRVLKAPEFVVSEPFVEIRRILNPKNFSLGTFRAILREILKATTPDQVIIESISFVD